MRHTPQPRQPRFRLGAWLGLWCACALAAPIAQAQVTRCVDPGTGKVTYTDGACASGARATEIERRKTDEELAQDRAREQEALQAKAERREQELVQRRLQADERADDLAQRAANRPSRSNPAQSAACQQSRERYSAASDAAADKAMGSSAQLEAAKRQMELDCLGPEAYSRLEASRPAPSAVLPADPYWDRYPYGRPPPRPPVVTPPAPAPSITRCDVFKCVDAQGYSHPRGQIGETVRPPSPSANPRSCRSQGGTAPC
ncbi:MULTISPECIES: DUF4124 domain-containing protein [Comamonas]|jgi:hypothetical protein|uniref:DUF4124 domain-containing protein n=1 Tax=Comamonas TaxID=283 RepID=UPI0015FA3038|nr:DUF4124 domain-containing protein [Comamonas koreensis]